MSSLIFKDDNVKTKCDRLADRYSLGINELLPVVEAFLLNENKDTMTIDLLGKLEQHILADNNRKRKLDDDVGLGKRTVSKTKKVSSLTNTIKQEHTSPVFSTSVFSTRSNRGHLVTSLNSELLSRGSFCKSTRQPFGSRCKISLSGDDFVNVSERFRYMFTPLEERTKQLEMRLLDLQRDMCQAMGIEEDTLQPVQSPSQSLHWFCGRLFCETEGNLNESSLILEGSYSLSGGRTVQLDISELDSCTLFPGQIILVEGINATGKRIVAKRLVDGVAKPKIDVSSSERELYGYSKEFQDGKALELLIASGPFTTSDNLDYEPFEELLKQVLLKKPDVVVLVGPFVDSTHPLLKDGNIVIASSDSPHEASYETIFVEKIVRDGLQRLFNSEEDYGLITTQFIMIPSLLDAHHEHVFPQPPFGDRDAIRTDFFEEQLGILDIPYSSSNDKLQRVHLMSNPCMFRVNDILVAISSNDVLSTLSQHSFSKKEQDNRIATLARHILKQQSFVPSFPHGVDQLDLRQLKHLTFRKTPDLLIVPSRLKEMARCVDDTIVVNPSSLARGSAGGCYAEVSIGPTKADSTNRAERFKVEILKI